MHGKRGYLLHGPPGTGKSSMIAAMANHLKYDIYDLELTKVCDLSQITKLSFYLSLNCMVRFVTDSYKRTFTHFTFPLDPYGMDFLRVSRVTCHACILHMHATSIHQFYI